MDEETKQWIRDSYPMINEKQISLISEEAYDQGHHAGQEEVNVCAKGLTYFIVEILEAI